MKKVCVISTTRAEYGLLRWTIEALDNDPDLEMQFIVSGTHLSSEFGHTIDKILEDGISISKRVPYISSDRTSIGILRETAKCCTSIGEVLYELRPDILLVLGDRYELLPICTSALLLNIPIAHIAGGETTEGAIDDQVRNAVTMMASLHFPNSEDAASNIQRMLGTSANIFNVGEPCIENYYKLSLKSRSEVSSLLGINYQNNWILVTLHPETKQCMDDNLTMAKNTIEVLLSMQYVEIIITESNADYGGKIMNDYFRDLSQQYENIHLYHSLGQLNYLSLMRESWCVIGNSSSGVIETPFLGIPTINIGNRQKGRRLANNVIQSSIQKQDILSAIQTIIKGTHCSPDYSFGDGKTSQHILNHIKSYLYDNK